MLFDFLFSGRDSFYYVVVLGNLVLFGGIYFLYFDFWSLYLEVKDVLLGYLILRIIIKKFKLRVKKWVRVGESRVEGYKRDF